QWAFILSPIELPSSCFTGSCFIFFNSLLVFSSFRKSFLLPTKMMGTFGQKCFTSGVCSLDYQDYQWRSTSELHPCLDRRADVAYRNLPALPYPIKLALPSWSPLQYQPHNFQKLSAHKPRGTDLWRTQLKGNTEKFLAQWSTVINLNKFLLHALALILSQISSPSSVLTGACLIFANSFLVFSSFLKSFLLPTKMMGTFGQKCFTSGVCSLNYQDYQWRSTSELHPCRDKREVAACHNLLVLLYPIELALQSCPQPRCRQRNSQKLFFSASSAGLNVGSDSYLSCLKKKTIILNQRFWQHRSNNARRFLILTNVILRTASSRKTKRRRPEPVERSLSDLDNNFGRNDLLPFEHSGPKDRDSADENVWNKSCVDPIAYACLYLSTLFLLPASGTWEIEPLEEKLSALQCCR
ncbi:unnamed protein product, partial [Porites evermanni]